MNQIYNFFNLQESKSCVMAQSKIYLVLLSSKLYKKIFDFIVFLSIIIFIPSIISATEKGSKNDPNKNDYRIGFLPVLSFNSDEGFGYGIIAQVDKNGNKEFLPYLTSHRIIMKRSTGGTTEYSYQFDSKYIMPKDLRITLQIKYKANKLEPFHGFGGAQTKYVEAFTDSKSGELFRGKFYYNYDKKYFRINTILQGNIYENKFRWLGGISIMNTKNDTIKYSEFEKDIVGNSKESLLAKIQVSDIIDRSIFAGGNENSFLIGIVLDTRDDEVTPSQGVWTDALLRWVPNFSANDYSFVSLTGTYRGYFSIKDDLTLALRLSGRLMSNGAPFFTVSQQEGSFKMTDGLGSNKTIRGILYQRILGRNNLFGNIELRYKFRKMFKSGYAALSSFYDFGRSFDSTPILPPADVGIMNDNLHQSVGAGFRIAFNSSFVAAADMGFALDSKTDGEGVRLYLGLDWLF